MKEDGIGKESNTDEKEEKFMHFLVPESERKRTS
jgi:hypothetical protein